jgi:hypothetical protein
MYYLQINVEDVLQEKNNEDVTTFRRMMSVLLPDVDVTALKSIGGEKQSGVILLTVAVTGPVYDVYGSSFMIRLPFRLREAMSTLAAVDTTTKKREVSLPLQQQEEDKKKKSKAISQFNKKDEAPTTTTVVYDSVYFSRLYMALLATIMDDEDGLLRDHDASLLPQNIPPPQSLSNKVKDTSKKNKRFTFSRRGGKSQKYESGESMDGGIIPLEIDLDPSKSGDGTSHADIVRRTALQMEILSLAEEDMSIPQYQHVGDGKRSHVAKSPKAGGGTTSIMTLGRFGRKENPFDLAGFEYRPSFAGGSVSGTTASTMTSSDDISTNTGDETATLSSKYTMLSSASSVPTLSKSKKDSASRSSRFKFLQKRKGNKASSKPPLAPPSSRQMVQQEVFDPFSYDGDVINEEQEDRVEVGEADSVASGSTKETAEHSPVVRGVSRSFSEEESEARSLPASVPTSPVLMAEEDVVKEPDYEEETTTPVRYVGIDLALNEDLTCEYKKSKLSSITVDGTVQVSNYLCFDSLQVLFYRSHNELFTVSSIGSNKKPRPITALGGPSTHTLLPNIPRLFSSYQIDTREQKVRRARRRTKRLERIHLLHHTPQRERVLPRRSIQMQ